MPLDPCLQPARRSLEKVPHLGHPVLDRYLIFVASRCRPNTVRATACDLRAFFGVIAKEPDQVVPADVLAFIREQRQPRGDGRVVRLSDGESGLSSRTIKRRLSSLSGLFSWLVLLEEIAGNPVPRGLATRRQPGRRDTVALIRTPRTLPQVLDPDEVDALLAALRRWRDRAMVEAMLLGGLRRCEVLGLRMEDLRRGEARVFIHEGKAVTNGWSRSRHGSSAAWPVTWRTSAPRSRTRPRCSGGSRARAADSRCQSRVRHGSRQPASSSTHPREVSRPRVFGRTGVVRDDPRQDQTSEPTCQTAHSCSPRGPAQCWTSVPSG